MTPCGNVSVTRGVQLDAHGVLKKNYFPLKVFLVLSKVFQVLYKAIPPLSTKSQTDRAILASGIFSKPPGPTSLRPLESLRALRRGSGSPRVVRCLQLLSRRRCG